MEATRLTGVLGARIDGIDVRVLDDAELAELRALACEHEVVCVTGQSLAPLEQVAFSRRLGPPAGAARWEKFSAVREFAHASVHVDLTTRVARIDWK